MYDYDLVMQANCKNALNNYNLFCGIMCKTKVNKAQNLINNFKKKIKPFWIKYTYVVISVLHVLFSLCMCICIIFKYFNYI